VEITYAAQHLELVPQYRFFFEKPSRKMAERFVALQ
jgi:hypothetical protein